MVTSARNAMPVITTAQQLEDSIKALVAVEPTFLKIYEQTGLPEVRFRSSGFEALFNAIIGQQLSVKVAQTIRDRLFDAGLHEKANLQKASDETLRGYGLSRQKISYLRSLSAFDIDFDTLNQQDDETIIQTLTQIKGVGRWTAEIYLLFSLNRHDVCAHNDLALQVACEKAFALDKRPTERVMRTMAATWSPHRSAACYLLWAYYGLLKQREAIL